MVLPCLVVCGKWRCDVGGEWEFLLDKCRLPRNVLIVETVQLTVLCDILVAEFGESELMATKVRLSYMKDSSVEGEELPVFIKNNLGLAKFLEKFKEDRNKSLFVTFGDIIRSVPWSVQLNTPSSTSKRNREGVEPYVPAMVTSAHEDTTHVQNFIDGQEVGEQSTPQVLKRRSIVEPYVPEFVIAAPRGPLTGPNIIYNTQSDEYSTPPVMRRRNVDDAPTFDLNVAEQKSNGNQRGEDFITPPVMRRSNVVEAILTPTIDLNKEFFDEEDLDVHSFLKEVEAIEEEESIKSSGKRKGKEACVEDVVEVESDDGDDVSDVDVEEIDVRPRGYDKEFWDAFIEEEFGGSNAVEVMSSTSDDVPEVAANAEGMGHEKKHDIPEVNAQSGSYSQGETANVIRDETEHELDDIPPLFDDITYEVSEIPDLDNGDEDIWVGKTFANKSDCRIALAIYAIKNMFYFKQTRTRKDYFVANCADPKCEWRVTASQVRNSSYYKIKKALLEHTCSIETRCLFKKKATFKVIASVYKNKFSNRDARLKPKDVQQLVLEDMRISTSYSKCWRVKETGNEELRGSEEDSFKKLAEYLYVLKLANPNTIADIETITDIETGAERFLYVFLAFKASIDGFRNLRRVLVLDGTHLNGKYKGVLLTASGQDANFQVFPLAFAVVDIEDDDSWTWFLSKIEGHIIADSSTLSIISDRHQSISKAKKTVFPLSKHGACVIHLARNVSGQFRNKGLGKLMIRAACAYKVSDFKDCFDEIEIRNRECARYLKDLGYAFWARAYFPGNRYNMMTSNIAESLNNALRKGRDLPITELLMFIQVMLTRWFSERRNKAVMNRGFVTPEVEKLIRRNLEFAKGNTIAEIEPWCYAVTGRFGRPYTVHLRDRGCTCRRYTLLQIPCSHALLAADKAKVSYGRLAGECYNSAVWLKTYAGVIRPHVDPKEIDIPEEVRSRVLLPPKTRRPPGRPRTKRLPSFGELSGKKVANKCGRCGGTGHNKTSCKQPI